MNNNQKKEEFLINLESIELDNLTVDVEEASKLYDNFTRMIEGQKSINSFLTNSVSQFILANVCQENHVFLNHIDTRYNINQISFTDSDLVFILNDMKEEELNKYRSKFNFNTKIIRVDDSKLIKKNIISDEENEKTR